MAPPRRKRAIRRSEANPPTSRQRRCLPARSLPQHRPGLSLRKRGIALRVPMQ